MRLPGSDIHLERIKNTVESTWCHIYSRLFAHVQHMLLLPQSSHANPHAATCLSSTGHVCKHATYLRTGTHAHTVRTDKYGYFGPNPHTGL